jgi:hypothetical protein
MGHKTESNTHKVKGSATLNPSLSSVDMELLDKSSIWTLFGTPVSMLGSLCPIHVAVRIPDDMKHLQ